MMLVLYILGVVVSMLVIWRACDGFESASNYLGRNMTEGVRGATINAIGSSIPELLTAGIALVLYKNTSGFAFGIGTTAGSAIFNSAIIPGLVIATVVLGGVAKYVKVSRKVVLRDGLMLIFAELVLIVLLAGGSMGLEEGGIMIGLYGAYMCIMALISSGGEIEEYEDDLETKKGGKWTRISAFLALDLRFALFGNAEMSFLRSWVLIIAATTVIGGACFLLVECCMAVGTGMGIAPYFVAVILAAAATSVPDTILSMKDAKKGNYDDAVSNALGSNIFDILICLGLPVFLYSLITGERIVLEASNTGSIAELRVLLLFVTVLIFLLFLIGKKMALWKAWVMFALYGGFVTFIVGRAYDNPLALYISGYLQEFLLTINSIFLI